MTRNTPSQVTAFDRKNLSLHAHVPASSRVFDDLRNRIAALELPPGTTLSRIELAERYGVSQSPVREAILRLEQLGVVVSYRQSRTEVTKIDPASVREEHFLRTALECEVANFLAEKETLPTFIKAKGFIKIQEALVDDISQIELFNQMDQAFHRELFVAANQVALHELVVERSVNMSRLRMLDLPRNGKMKSVLDAHKAVIKAIESGNGADAAKAMRDHLSGTIDRMPEIIQENEQYFL